MEWRSAGFAVGKLLLLANSSTQTSLSSKSLAVLLGRAQRVDFAIELIHLALPNTQTAVDHVAARVKQGGQDTPMIVINRRFRRSLQNLLGLYIPLVNRWKVFDNYSTLPVLIARGTRTPKWTIQEQAWQALNEIAQKA